MSNHREGSESSGAGAWPSWPAEAAATAATERTAGTAPGAPADPAEGVEPVDPRVSNTARLVLVAGLATFALIRFGLSAFYIVAALLVSIVLHEFGHFWVARRSGMKVSEFFIGFGPRLWSFRRGEVEYGLKAIPAGAYVRIVGMNDLEEIDPADEDRTYRSKGTFKRLFTVLAGPAMNLLIAFVLMTTLFLAYGRETGVWTVKGVPPGSGADRAGVQKGDRLVAIDGEPVGEWDAFRQQLADRAGKQVTLAIERDGRRFDQPVDLGWRLDPPTAAAFPSQPAVSPGDVIESADGRSLPRYEDLRALLAEPGPPVLLRIVRTNPDPTDPDSVVRDPYELRVDRPYALPADGAAGFLGVEPASESARETPIGAVGETLRVLRDGVVATGSVVQHVFSPSGVASLAGQVADATQATTTLPAGSVGRLTPVDGSPEPRAANLPDDRPISIFGIVALGTQAADAGLASFLVLVAGVNLALALINLLPMLPFDGGHAAIAVYEGIRGRLRGAPYRADLTKLMPFVYGFVAVLVLLAGSTMFLDFVQPLSLR